MQEKYQPLRASANALIAKGKIDARAGAAGAKAVSSPLKWPPVTHACDSGALRPPVIDAQQADEPMNSPG
ncbi:MAG TPA: hypothetical protein VIM34_05240 [Burkholderiaceae bacterium]